MAFWDFLGRTTHSLEIAAILAETGAAGARAMLDAGCGSSWVPNVSLETVSIFPSPDMA
jgi:hypothetical protein